MSSPLTATGTTIFLLILYIAAGGLLLSFTGMALLTSCLLAVVSVGTWLVISTYRPDWLTYPGQAGAAESSGGRAVMTWGLGLVLALVAGQLASMWAYDLIGSQAFEATQNVRSAAPALLTWVLMLIAAPMGEEAFFRGLLYPRLRRQVGMWFSIGLTSAAFCLVHGNLVQALATLPLAIWLALARERTGRLAPCVAGHVVFNLAAMLVPAQVVLALSRPAPVIILLTAFAVWVKRIEPGSPREVSLRG